MHLQRRLWIRYSFCLFSYLSKFEKAIVIGKFIKTFEIDEFNSIALLTDAAISKEIVKTSIKN